MVIGCKLAYMVGRELPPVSEDACPAELHHSLEIAFVAADRVWREPSLVSKMIEKLRNEPESVSVQVRVVSAVLCAGCCAEEARLVTKNCNINDHLQIVLGAAVAPMPVP